MKMTKEEAVEQYRSEILPAVKAEFEKDGVPDYPARAEAWNNFTDGLHKSRVITRSQYDTWTHPPENEPRKKKPTRAQREGAIGVTHRGPRT